jgi:hypothetical protein
MGSVRECSRTRCINKQEARARFLEAIGAALRGEGYLSAEMTRQLVGSAVAGKAKRGGIESLRDRELFAPSSISRRQAGIRSMTDIARKVVRTRQTQGSPSRC